MTGFILRDFTPMARNSLLGFAVIQAPSGLIFHDVAIHRQGDSMWAMPASKPMLSRDGTQMKDAAGKLRWQPIISFADRKTRERWSSSVVAAVKEQRPEVLV
jgi:hypothetical protein